MSTLTHPKGTFHSIFFNETLDISYWGIDEWIWLLRLVIWPIWKNGHFTTGPPSIITSWRAFFGNILKQLHILHHRQQKWQVPHWWHHPLIQFPALSIIWLCNVIRWGGRDTCHNRGWYSLSSSLLGHQFILGSKPMHPLTSSLAPLSTRYLVEVAWWWIHLTIHSDMLSSWLINQVSPV